MAGFWTRLFGGGDTGPRARRVKPTVRSAVALAQHPVVHLDPKGQSKYLKLPLWVEVERDSATPPTYEHIFWDVDPVGEYLYYLAGDFEKNEKGLLRFGTASLEFRVERNFETDVLEHVRTELPGSEGRDWRQIFEGETCASIVDRIAAVRPDPGPDGWTVPHVTGIDLGKGLALMRVQPDAEGEGIPRVTLVYRKVVPEGPEVPVEYVVEVVCISRRARQEVIPLLDGFRELINRYRDMPYIPVHGAMRL